MLQSPNRPAPRLRTFRQQLDDARFTQFTSDSPCDDPTRFATRSPTYGSYRAVPERRRHFLRKSGGRRTFSPPRGCVWIPLLRKKACCPEGSQDADPGGPFEDHCRGIKLRRPCAGVGQTPAERAAFLVEGTHLTAAGRWQDRNPFFESPY